MDTKKEQQLVRYKDFFQILNQWMFLKEENRDIDEIIEHAGVNRLAIYGMGDLCRHIIFCLEKTNIVVKYVIDKESFDFYDGLQVVTLEEKFEDIDAVIYTNPYESEEIIMTIKKKFKCPVISFMDIVFDNILG